MIVVCVREGYTTNMISFRLPIVLLLIMAGSGCDEATSPAERPDLQNIAWLSDCERPQTPALNGFYADSLCGTVSVPENPASPEDKQIGLSVMIAPALSTRPKPDPIVFLAGGPGQAARDIGPQLFSRLKDLRNERDIVFVDQRGTGGSNPLNCSQGNGLIDEIGKSPRTITQEQVGALKTCLHEFDADPAFYTTPIAMDDLDTVRKTIGYEQINLYGISYGTRAALVYLRRHESRVRSAVLDGLAPPTMQIPANMATDAGAAFEQLLLDCEGSPACNSAFEDLRVHVKHLIKRLELSAEEVSLVHPGTGQPLKSYMDKQTLTGLIRAILYDRTLSSVLPLALEEAFSANYQPLMTLAYSFIGERNDISAGMMASVLCSEDMTFMSDTRSTDGYFNNSLYEVLIQVCEFWPSRPVDESYGEPVTSEVPVLLVSGGLDPVTPAGYAVEAAETLPNSRHIIVPGAGHGASIYGCMPNILRDFFGNPGTGKIDDSCVKRLGRPPFFTSYAGPVPLGETGE